MNYFLNLFEMQLWSERPVNMLCELRKDIENKTTDIGIAFIAGLVSSAKK